MDNKKKFCQSCGMPLDKRTNNEGTNADGSKSEKFCMYCYQNGVLAGEGMTVDEFQEFCRQAMIKNGHNKLKAWLFTRGFRRLERWKKQ
ncbi:MAG: zinc ribbon domain-containing protein [Bacteroidales bacterium]|nr:zinc ribbon domain-containing protein [Bacteroidales bacterium]